MYQVQGKRQGVVLPKGPWMRYSLKWAPGNDENMRNLEALGLFRIPRKNDGSPLSCFVEDP